MKDITLSVPDDVFRAAQVRAEERGVTVSTLLANYLRALSAGQRDFQRLHAQQQRVQQEISRFRARDRLSRDDLHSRAVH